MQRPTASLLAALLAFVLSSGPAAGRQEGPAETAPHPGTAAPSASRVPWRPWGDAAFKEAADSGRLVLLYISAAWNHYDQVMSELTFSDPNVAAIAESAYVPVRVDTDERPDIFARYGMGGWPTTAVLLPDGQPMYYLGKDDKVARAGGMFYPPEPFISYFSQLASYYAQNREMVANLTKSVDDSILSKRNVDQAPVTSDAMEAVVSKILDTHKILPVTPEPGDHHPEFDMVDLSFLYWFKKSDRKVLDFGLAHLTDMGRGGIYDRLGGGFHRYAHDSMFIVPAFEKVPAVNAAALRAYLQAYEVTGNGRFLVFAQGTLDHVLKYGIDPASHAFRGAMAAGASAADNGDYYTWTEDEVKQALTSEEFAIASIAWNIFPFGEMVDTAPKKNVIFLAEGPKALALLLSIDEKHAEEVLESARVKLLAVRDRRPAPPVDPRTLGDSSAMMTSAFLQAGRTLHRPELKKQAMASLEILLGRCRAADDLIAHVCDPAGGTRGREAFLSDQACTAAALLDAHEESGSPALLAEARSLADRTMGLFRDSISGGFSDRRVDPNAQGLMSWPVRDLRDNMEMAKVLVRLGHLTGDRTYLDRARKTLESWADEVGTYEEHGSPYAVASQMLLTPPLEILVVGDPNDPAGDAARERALALYHPWRVVRHYALGGGKEDLARRGLKPLGGPQVAFCSGEECAGPFPGAEPLRKHLGDFLNKGKARGGSKSPPKGKQPDPKGGA